MEILKKCSYCDNPVNGNRCYVCNEESGVVEGYYNSKNEFVELERDICSRCKELELYKIVNGKPVCVECLQEEE